MDSPKLPAKKKHPKKNLSSDYLLPSLKRNKKHLKRKNLSLRAVNESLKSLDIHPLNKIEKGNQVETCQSLDQELKSQVRQSQNGVPEEPKSRGALIRIQKLQRRNWLKSNLSKNPRSKIRCAREKKERRNIVRNLRKQEKEWDAKCHNELKIFDESQQARSQQTAVDNLLAESDWNQLNCDFSKWNVL